MRLLKVISLIGTGIFVTGFGVAHAAQASFQCLIAPPSKIPVSIDVSVEIQNGQTRGRYQMQSDVKGAKSSIGVADEITNSVGDKFYRLTWWTVAGPAYLVVNEKTGAYIHKVPEQAEIRNNCSFHAYREIIGPKS